MILSLWVFFRSCSNWRVLALAFVGAALLSGCLSTAPVEQPLNDVEILDDTECIELDAPVPVATITKAKTNATAKAAAAPKILVYDHPSPNFDVRKLPVTLIVIHYTAAPFKESMNALCNPRGKNRVSAHYLIDTNGKTYRLVNERMRAWHAGVSHWRKINDVNSASIGIELVNLGHDKRGRPRPYPAAQIEAVTKLCLNIQARYPITEVVGHSDVAPTRKIDPGELFPWKKLANRGVRVRGMTPVLTTPKGNAR